MRAYIASTAFFVPPTIVTNQATAGAVTTAGTLDLQSGGPPTYANLGTATNIAAFRADPRFAGIDGAGYSVVVIDTGIDLDHPHFGPDGDGDGIADRIVFQYDFFGANDASAADGAGHGTHVAGIVASGDATYPGVAPGANLIVLKVFPDGSGAASYGDIVEAANWVVVKVFRSSVDRPPICAVVRARTCAVLKNWSCCVDRRSSCVAVKAGTCRVVR